MNLFELFDVEQANDVLVIRLADTRYFDTDSYSQLQQELVKLVEDQPPRKVAVDLSRVGYCSTAVINSLLMIQRRVQTGGGGLKLFGLSDVTYETLERLRLTNLLDVQMNETVARASF